jgi:hypothetical protein
MRFSRPHKIKNARVDNRPRFRMGITETKGGPLFRVGFSVARGPLGAHDCSLEIIDRVSETSIWTRRVGTPYCMRLHDREFMDAKIG